jgi:hypothetical protein
MRLNRTGAAVAALAAGLLTLTGCSTVSTAAQEVALAYGGGSFDSANFVKCFGGGFKSTTEGASDNYKYYPTGQRDFSFGNGKGLDSAALTSTTSGAITLQVEGTVKFTMNLSCRRFKDPNGKTWPGGTAQFFHELIGSKDFDGGHAYNEEGSQNYGDGWSGMLRQYMGFAVNRVIDDSALGFTREQLTTDPAAKIEWEAAVTEALPTVLQEMTGDVEIFRIEKVLLQRPEPPRAIADANVEKEAAKIRAEATEIDKTTAAGFPGGIEAWSRYQAQQAQNEALKTAAEKGQAFPIPYGSDLIVQPPR